MREKTYLCRYDVLVFSSFFSSLIHSFSHPQQASVPCPLSLSLSLSSAPTASSSASHTLARSASLLVILSHTPDSVLDSLLFITWRNTLPSLASRLALSLRSHFPISSYGLSTKYRLGQQNIGQYGINQVYRCCSVRKRTGRFSRPTVCRLCRCFHGSGVDNQVCACPGILPN